MKGSLSPQCNSQVEHSTFELTHLTITLPRHAVSLFCLYRPPPNRKNKYTDAQFLEQFLDFLVLDNSLKGSLLIMRDFNFQFGQPSDTYTSKLLDLVETFGLSQSVTTAPHQHGHILDWVLHCPDTILSSLPLWTTQSLPTTIVRSTNFPAQSSAASDAV